jgi:hypothetical protein
MKFVVFGKKHERKMRRLQLILKRDKIKENCKCFVKNGGRHSNVFNGLKYVGIGFNYVEFSLRVFKVYFLNTENDKIQKK